MWATKRAANCPKRCAAIPIRVVLLDEVEKAHPDVFNILLQVLDDGRITDSQGHLVDFRNTIVIMTSNIGSEHILEVAGDDSRYDEMRKRVLKALRKPFPPRVPQPGG
jgi:ATP-dependent Clp protease ATP-binding subunit ClpB